jgi:alpha-ketoglutaric semialdehyde dehydrogenase
MDIQGTNIIGFGQFAGSAKILRGYNPREGAAIEPDFHEANAGEVERALDLAEAAAVELRALSAERIADFLLAIREEILALGDALLQRASLESGLDIGRLSGERDRTTNQIKMFADLVREGSWLDVRIDPAIPDRKPLPRADLRRMLRPIGPVAVFGASNFPLAFSVAGGDTAAAFAAGNPVVVKAHPAHPGTSEMVALAIVQAVRKQNFPEGTFSLLHGITPETSLAVVNHPKTKAVAFTGSERAGRALFDAAARRAEPIPVYAEMGSTNPIFVLPGALAGEGKPESLADALYKSVTLGVGQLCTCPGLVFGVESEQLTALVNKLVALFEQSTPGTMLNPAIAKNYRDRFENAAGVKDVRVYKAERPADSQRTEGRPGLLVTDAATWLRQEALHEEIFGPSTVVIRCNSDAELLTCAKELSGSLTATLHGTAADLAGHMELVNFLTQKAGRILFNGFPTGVEVGHAIYHGGPYPATTDPKFTSVGATSIYRFVRPVCYQNFPEELLPPELQNANPRGIWRRIDGQLTKNALS